MVRFSRVGRVCGFCGVIADEDTRLSGGLGVMICDSCTRDCYDGLSSAKANDPARRPPWEAMSDLEVLARLPEIATVAQQVNEFMVEWVALLRARGLSWAAIGQAMGVSRQAAWERFSRAVDPARQSGESG